MLRLETDGRTEIRRGRVADIIGSTIALGRQTASRRILYVAVLALLAGLPFIVSANLAFTFELILLYASASLGLNLAVGYSGELILGQATVMGVAGYAAAILSVNYGWNPWATLVIAIVAGIVWQVVLALPGLRVQGLYLALISFFGVLVFQSLTNLFPSVTGAEAGVSGLPQLISSSTGLFEIVVAVFVVSFILVRNVVVSSWGQRLRLLRDAPNALVTLGVNVRATKMTVYIVSALPAALAGWTLAFVNQSVTPSLFGLTLTLTLFASVQIVAPGSLYGPIVGTAIIEGYSQLIGPFSAYNVVGVGVIMALCVIVLARLRQSSGLPTLGLLRHRAHSVLKVEAVSAYPRPHEHRELGRMAPLATDDREIVRPPFDLREPTAANSLLLEAHDLSKSFGGNQAVKSVNLEIPAGKVVALIGDNGSGKTTILNLITRLIRADAGRIVVLGHDATELTASEVANLGLGRTFQVPQLIVDVSARENIESGLLGKEGSSIFEALFAPWRAARRTRKRSMISAAVAEELGLDRRVTETRQDRLPLGLRRLVEVGRAISSGARIVCLDEPTAGLNDQELSELGRVLRSLVNDGRSIILVEHHIRFVLEFCDEIILLRRGRVEGVFGSFSEGELPELLADYVRHIPNLGRA